jgi:hypothetical protein
LEVAAACAFDIVAYMVAVFFGGEPRDSEFAAVYEHNLVAVDGPMKTATFEKVRRSLGLNAARAV